MKIQQIAAVSLVLYASLSAFHDWNVYEEKPEALISVLELSKTPHVYCHIRVVRQSNAEAQKALNEKSPKATQSSVTSAKPSVDVGTARVSPKASAKVADVSTVKPVNLLNAGNFAEPNGIIDDSQALDKPVSQPEAKSVPNETPETKPPSNAATAVNSVANVTTESNVVAQPAETKPEQIGDSGSSDVSQPGQDVDQNKKEVQPTDESASQTQNIAAENSGSKLSGEDSQVSNPDSVEKKEPVTEEKIDAQVQLANDDAAIKEAPVTNPVLENPSPVADKPEEQVNETPAAEVKTEEPKDTQILKEEGQNAPSENLRGNQTPPETVEGNQTPPENLEGNQTPSETLEGKQAPSENLEGNQTPPENLEGNQTPPENLEGKQTPPEENANPPSDGVGLKQTEKQPAETKEPELENKDTQVIQLRMRRVLAATTKSYSQQVHCYYFNAKNVRVEISKNEVCAQEQLKVIYPGRFRDEFPLDSYRNLYVLYDMPRSDQNKVEVEPCRVVITSVLNFTALVFSIFGLILF